MRVGDSRLQVSDLEQLARGRRVDRGETTAKMEGCLGVSIVAEIIPYISPNNFWIVPVPHALLFGVIAGFFDYALRPLPMAGGPPILDIITKAERDFIRRMAGCISVPSDAGRKYKCIILYRQVREDTCGEGGMKVAQHFERQNQYVQS